MTTQNETQGAVGTEAPATDPTQMALIERQREMALTTFGNGITPFSNGAAFRLACNMAERLASSTIVPKSYQGNPSDMLVVIDYATRLGMSPIALAQNMDVVHGRPGLRGALIAGIINKSPLFSRLKFQWRGTDNPNGDPSMDHGCRAFATEAETGDVLYGAWIDWRMVVGEGWSKNAKWSTMREQMFMYRASAFWGRAHASDILLGLHSSEELEDVIDGEYSKVPPAAARLNRMTDEPVTDSETVTATVVEGSTSDQEPRSNRRQYKPKQKSAPAAAADPATEATDGETDVRRDGDDQQPDPGEETSTEGAGAPANTSFNLE